MTAAQGARELNRDAAAPGEEDLPFERALEELEGLVERLEAGDLSLDAAVAAYERGMALLGSCTRRLAEVERRIEILSRRADGSCQTEPFEPGPTSQPPSAAVEDGAEGEHQAGDGLPF